MTKSSDGTAKSDPKRPVTGGPNRPHPLPFVFSHFLALHTFRAQRPIVQTHNKGLLTLITPPLQHLQVTNALNLGLFFFFFETPWLIVATHKYDKSNFSICGSMMNVWKILMHHMTKFGLYGEMIIRFFESLFSATSGRVFIPTCCFRRTA